MNVDIFFINNSENLMPSKSLNVDITLEIENGKHNHVPHALNIFNSLDKDKITIVDDLGSIEKLLKIKNAIRLSLPIDANFRLFIMQGQEPLVMSQFYLFYKFSKCSAFLEKGSPNFCGPERLVNKIKNPEFDGNEYSINTELINKVEFYKITKIGSYIEKIKGIHD